MRQRECLAWALDRSASGIQRADLQEIPDIELREETLSFYRSLEAARYGGGGQVNVQGVRSCLKKILEMR